MGVCASCLGRDRPQRSHEHNETSRLLNDGPRQPNYGLSPNGPTSVTAIDPLDVQREEAALQRIVMQTSDKFLDIFALQRPPTDAPISTDASAADAKIQYYQRLMQQVCESESPSKAMTSQSRGSSSESGSWSKAANGTAASATPMVRPVNSDGVGPLVGGFGL